MAGLRNVVIGGGTGLVGKALLSKLIADNYSVRLISRSPKRKGDLSWKTVEICGLPEDTDIVINLAGRNIGEVNPKFLIPKFQREMLDEVRVSRLDTTKWFAKSLPKTTTQFINASAIGFYKPDLNRTYTEDDPYVDNDFISRLCRDWEAACAGPDPQKVQAIQVRIGVVLSKYGGALSSMYAPHRLGLGGPIAGGRQWLSWIHVQDLVNLFHFIIANPAAKSLRGPINATAPNPVRQAHFSRALSQCLGAPSFGGRLPVPGLLARAMLGSERQVLLIGGQRVLPAKAQAAGFRFTYPTLGGALSEIYGGNPSTPVPVD